MRRRNRHAPRRAAALLEVIAAIAILGSAGVAAIELCGAWSKALAGAREREDMLTRADRLMSNVALWPREDLDRHLGTRAEGEWFLELGRFAPTMYHVTIRDTAFKARLIETDLYRPFPDSIGKVPDDVR